MYKSLPIDTRTAEERAESYRSWATKTDAEKWAETVRLSVEHYRMPIGDLRDGPVLKYQRMPDRSERILAKWSGPKPLRHLEQKEQP